MKIEYAADGRNMRQTHFKDHVGMNYTQQWGDDAISKARQTAGKQWNLNRGKR